MKLGERALEPDLLYMFVFGPGYGESIVLRIPPDDWLIIDSLRCQTSDEDSNPALALLDLHDATIAGIALTHPHTDHARGLIDLLERRRPGSPVGLANVHLAPNERWRVSQDASVTLDTGAVAAALNRIDHIWKHEPSSKWLLAEGTRRKIGAATVQVLSPPSDAKRQQDPNRLSSAMLVKWDACRILLGADLPSVGWKAVTNRASSAAELAESHALKVSHHGSDKAQHATAIGSPPPRDRVCVTTPFNRGRQLPSYADGHGIDQLLRTHMEIGVTAVPHHARGRSTPRAQMQPRQEQFGAVTLTYEQAKAGARQAWIANSFDRAGKRIGTWSGDAAGSVVA